MQACRLSVSDLACQRGDRLLFRGLSFSLEAGEALHVTGANGIGKSSLIRIVAGLMRPFAGEIERDGQVALLDEKPALDGALPLAKALQFWAGVDGCGDMAGNAAMLGIGELLDIPVRYLSTGQKKRAAFVRLLNQSAPVWMLDEPLNGLDTQAQTVIESLIAQHCAEGGICLIASHQPIAVADIKLMALAEFAP